MAKRLTEKQKKEIIKGFTEGETIEFISQKFNCTKLTVIRNIKINLGESKYKELKDKNKNSKKNNFNQTKEDLIEKNKLDPIFTENDFLPTSTFMEITPLNCAIGNESRKEISSIPIEEIQLPQIVYMIVDKKIELTVKLLKDYPDWSFLPLEDLNRKTIEIYLDHKTAKRSCNKEQKVIKFPNTKVFKIAARFLISKGISRIVSDDKLIAL